jgi:hypothetical protein
MMNRQTSRKVIATMIIILNPQQDLGEKMMEGMLKSRAQNQKEAVVMGKPSTSPDHHCIILADVSGHGKRRRSPTKARMGVKTRNQINQPK